MSDSPFLVFLIGFIVRLAPDFWAIPEAKGGKVVEEGILDILPLWMENMIDTNI